MGKDWGTARQIKIFWVPQKAHFINPAGGAKSWKDLVKHTKREEGHMAKKKEKKEKKKKKVTKKAQKAKAKKKDKKKKKKKGKK